MLAIDFLNIELLWLYTVPLFRQLCAQLFKIIYHRWELRQWNNVTS